MDLERFLEEVRMLLVNYYQLSGERADLVIAEHKEELILKDEEWILGMGDRGASAIARILAGMSGLTEEEVARMERWVPEPVEFFSEICVTCGKQVAAIGFKEFMRVGARHLDENPRCGYESWANTLWEHASGTSLAATMPEDCSPRELWEAAFPILLPGFPPNEPRVERSLSGPFSAGANP